MNNILFAVLSSTLIFIVFKLYPKFKINTLQAIIFNYLFAFLVGIFINKQTILITEIPEKPWFYASLILGILFICVFFTMGKTTQINGVSVASVASKMSMVLPILFGIFFLKEQLESIQIIGIFLAILAVYFSSKKGKSDLKSRNYIFPVLLFFGGGIIDTTINYVQKHWVIQNDLYLFTALTFFTAFSIGCVILIFQYVTKNSKIKMRNIVGGFCLGIPNYFSLYFLIEALQNSGYTSATVFTIINVGIIICTTIVAVFIFKEKLHKQNYIGIGLALLALFLIIQ